MIKFNDDHSRTRQYQASQGPLQGLRAGGAPRFAQGPVLVPGGRLVVNGLCPTCNTEVVAFQSATPWDALDGGRLNPMVVGILCMGLRAGFQQASEMAKQQRADDIFRAQKKLRATYRQIGDLFDLSAAGVAQAIADARRRAEAESGLRESVLDGRKRGRTRWQTAREHGLTKREVSSTLAKAHGSGTLPTGTSGS